MGNLIDIINTTNCEYCKFFKDKCAHDNAEENDADFNEIYELYLEDPSSFSGVYGRRHYCCGDFKYKESNSS